MREQKEISTVQSMPVTANDCRSLDENLTREDYQELIRSLERKNDCQTALNRILQISLSTSSIEGQLEQILTLILSIDWLCLEHKGVIFLVRDGELKLTVQKGVSAKLQKNCARVQRGECLCGKAASSQDLIYQSHFDLDNFDSIDENTEPGHYVIPLIYKEKTLGVLKLFTSPGHKRTDDESSFLESCANIISSIIHHKNIEDRMVFLSNHDDLTGLPNRRQLFSELKKLSLQAKRIDISFALLFVDLDFFKNVNDNLGHHFGDKVLQLVAQRLRECLRELDFVARNGGDEFVVVIQNFGTLYNVRHVGNMIIERLSEPYMVEGTEIHIGASVGVSVYPNKDLDIEDIEGLISQADKAMYKAKEHRGSVELA